jgi:hypothetical protein
MANAQEVTFQGYDVLVKEMKDLLARSVRSGTAAKGQFVDANGTTHVYRDTFELLKAIDHLQNKANSESAPPSQARRLISLVSPR